MKNFGYRIYNEHGDLIIVTVKSSDKIIFKKTCSLSNKDEIRKMLELLEIKGFISLPKSRDGWFK